MQTQLDINKIRITKENPYKICFVCLGNICRSPTAEGVFQHLVTERGLQPWFAVDSSGTSAWHVGEPANHNSRKVAKSHGVELLSRARKFDPVDFEEFNLILAMDHQNYRDILQLARDEEQASRIMTMRSFDPEPGDGEVPDPYQGGMDGFEHVYQILLRSSRTLLDLLETRIEPS